MNHSGPLPPSSGARGPSSLNRTIGFVLSSGAGNPLPSTRISVFNMWPYLQEAGYRPVISFQPESNTETPKLDGVATRMIAAGVSIAYFQKVRGPDALAAVATLRAAGVRTIFGVCDIVDPAMADATDATIVVTDFLRGLYPAELRSKIHVVHDGIEHPEYRRSVLPVERPLRRLSVVLVTSSELDEIPVLGRPPRFVRLTVVGRYPAPGSTIEWLRRWYWKFARAEDVASKSRVVRNMFGRGFAVRNWSADTVYEDMLRADVAAIPVDMRVDPVANSHASVWQVKSENRLTLAMALGLPVVASPVPAYLSVIEQGRNGFIATTRSEWLACLEALRDPGLRQAVGDAARATVIERFSMDEQARRLTSVLESLGSRTS